MFKVQLPEMPQTQKKEVSINMRKKRKQYIDRKYQNAKREKMTTAFNLLRECVPGIEKVGVTNRLNRPDMMIETVNYIKELQKKIKELETCHTPRTHPSEPVKTFAITLMKKINTTDAAVQTTSEAEEELPEEKLLPEQELLACGEELLPEEEELITDFNLELLVP